MKKHIHKARRRRPNFRRNDLAEQRRSRDLSLKRVSQILNIPTQTLEAYERGRYLPSLTNAFKLQILYRGQIASFYHPFYNALVLDIREAEERHQRGRA